jgi:hypothetical protein
MLGNVSPARNAPGGVEVDADEPSSYRQIWPKRAAIVIVTHSDTGVRRIGTGLKRNDIK